MKFTTTTNHSFTLSLSGGNLGNIEAEALKRSILDNIAHEAPEHRDTLLTAVIGTVNRELKARAVNAVMLSDDVLRALCNGATFGKFYIAKDGDTKTVNYGTAQKTIQTGKVDKTPVYENRPDYIQFSDVVNACNAYNRQLKKDGFKDVYSLKGSISAGQFNLLTVLVHNLSGKLSENDLVRLEKMGDNFAVFAGTSNGKRLQAVQFFYDLFNAHTGHDFKAIEFIVKDLKQDKKLATFDSIHYINTVPGEYTLLSVLINHYVNTGVKVLEKSRAKAVKAIKGFKEAENASVTGPVFDPAPVPGGIALDVQEPVPAVAVVIEPPCMSDNRAMEYTASALEAYKNHTENGVELPGNITVATAENGNVVITYNR